MSRLNDSGALAMGVVAAAMFSVGVSLASVACGTQPSEAKVEATRVEATSAAPSANVNTLAPIASVGAAIAERGAQAVLTASAVTPAAVVAPVKSETSTKATSTKATSTKATAGALVVKRFVVAEGVKDREPVASDGAFSASGKPIYAFAELANGSGEETQVRITFERKGSSDRVGNVTLSVPANSSRYRTWGNTRFVREGGTWEAVLWSENGAELSRTSFDVVGS
ncbi:MAG: DUF2914 domain-containing protein [Polyangiaceae bacterium]